MCWFYIKQARNLEIDSIVLMLNIAQKQQHIGMF